MAAEVACVPVSGYRRGKIHSASEIRIGKSNKFELVGSDFGRPGELYIDGVLVDYDFWSNDRISAVLQPHHFQTPGQHKVVVKNAFGESEVFSVTVVDEQPKSSVETVQLTGISDPIEIRGENFGNVPQPTYLRRNEQGGKWTTQSPKPGSWAQDENRNWFWAQGVETRQPGHWSFDEKPNGLGQWSWRPDQQSQLIKVE